MIIKIHAREIGAVGYFHDIEVEVSSKPTNDAILMNLRAKYEPHTTCRFMSCIEKARMEVNEGSNHLSSKFGKTLPFYFSPSSSRPTFYEYVGYRKPKEGDWYVSGAIMEAYKAYRDLSKRFHIVRPIFIAIPVTTYRRGEPITG